MSNENPNNTPHWRNKLDEMKHLPGSSFTSDAAWDKLYGRLRGNKNSKKIFWYWIAAACLVFALIITVLNYHKNASETSTKQAAVKQEREINKHGIKVEAVDNKKNEGGNENVNELGKDKMVAASNKPIQRKRRLATSGVAAKVQSNDVAINYPEQQPVAKSLQIVNNSTIAVVPAKKKLNVVHINELGYPVPETDMLGKIDRRYKMKLANGEVYGNPSTVYKNTDFTILKTKL